MKATLVWKEKLAITAHVGSHEIPMDAGPPLSTETGPNPKEVLMASVMGCTAMDVISLMKKFRQNVDDFSMSAEGETTDHHPKVLKEIRLTYRFTGAIDPEKAKEACHASMTRYCAVSAMVAKVSPISYVIEINGERVHEDKATFAI